MSSCLRSKTKCLLISKRELENLLHCQIATTADLSLLRSSISRPNESIVQYNRLLEPYRTPLWAELYSKFGDVRSFSRLFRFAKDATSELGEWAADHLWSIGLADEEAKKVERDVEQSFLAEKEARPVEELNSNMERIREAQRIVKSHLFGLPSFEGNSISTKVMSLHACLNSIFEKPTDARCIVFVKQRYTARLLGEIFKRIGNPNIRFGLLIGTNSGEPGDVKFTFRQQVLTLMKFRKGALNCLFATSIAEEGLDIPDCNTIIRFDLYSTLIQYIQSRGRARHKNSRYVHMTEKGNQHHLQAVRDVRSGEVVLRNFCSALPADRLLQGNDCDLEDMLSKERTHRTYTDPITKAKLTYRSSLNILAHFVGSLPHDHETVLQATYIMSVEDKQYVCEVLLPEIAPIRSVFGRPSSRKAVAKCSAAFEACLLLRKKCYLDANLLPIYHKHLPAMRNARLALNMRNTDAYEMRVKPSLWERDWGTVPDALHVTVIDLSSPESVGRPSQPLAILTRAPLPQFPSFPLHVRPSTSTDVLCNPVHQTLELNGSMLSQLTSFTLRVYKDIFNKTYEVNEAQMSYWLAPISKIRSSKFQTEQPYSLIDWTLMEFVHNNEEISWKIDTPFEDLADKYLIDRWDGGRRFFSVRVEPELKPSDPVPDGSATHKYMNNILDYTVSLFAKSRARATWRPDQPVLLAHRVVHRRNWLDEWNEAEQNVKIISYVCPEPLKFSAVRR